MTNHTIQFLVVLLLLGATYYFTKQTTDNYYKTNSYHKTDTIYVYKFITLPKHIDTLKVKVYINKTDSAKIDTAYQYLTKERFRMIASKVDTVIKLDTLGTHHIQFDPLTRVLITGLELFPIKLTNTIIHDSISTPYPVYDSFTKQATLTGIGALAGIILTLLLHG